MTADASSTPTASVAATGPEAEPGAGAGGMPLVEREGELESLRTAIAAAASGAGRVVLVEALGGLGKTRLLSEGREIARRAGLRTLWASGSELERSFAFGVVRQLFEPVWLSCSGAQRAALRAGPAQPAAELLDATGATSGRLPADDRHAIVRGLYGLAREFATRAPAELHTGRREGGLAMFVDDLDWCDAGSIAFLAYLGERIAELPLTVILACRPREPSFHDRALAALRSRARSVWVRPLPLRGPGTAALVRVWFPDASDRFCATCATVTGGNVFLLTELLGALGGGETGAAAPSIDQVASQVPASVVEWVCAQLARFAPAAASVARALAVLGDGASLHETLTLAGADAAVGSRAADSLVACGLLIPGSYVSFVSPLVREAVRATIPELERGQTHARAARMLAGQRASVERIAAQLLQAPVGQGVDAVETLRAAATKVRRSRQPALAAELLKRALAEHAADPQQSAELRAELALAEGHALCAAGRHAEAAVILDAGLIGLGANSGALGRELLGSYLSAAARVEGLRTRVAARRRELLGRLGEPTALERVALAGTTLSDVLAGVPRSAVRRNADLAWGDGALLRRAHDASRSSPPLVTALLFTDELERAVEICDATLAGADHDADRPAVAMLQACRSWARYAQGLISAAERDARAALRLRDEARSAQVPSALGVLACCQIEQGKLNRTLTLLSALKRRCPSDSLARASMLEIRARAKLAALRPEEALRDAVDAGQVLASVSAEAGPGVIAWRSTAALAHLALGERKLARRLAERELAVARHTGATRVVIRGLRVLGLASPGPGGVKLLREAVETGDRGPTRLEHIAALVELGAALRRANRRVEARDPLRRALELSSKDGASAIAVRARAELIATGARPRRAALTGASSLTVSQRRVAELAARGLTTRRIAQTLFVTPKTVEFHLRNTYKKLGIESRDQLARALRLP